MPLSSALFFLCVSKSWSFISSCSLSNKHTKLELLYRVCNILSRKQKWLVACFLYLLRAKKLLERSKNFLFRTSTQKAHYTYYPDVEMSSIVKKCAIQVVLRKRRWKKFLSIVSVWGSAQKMWICKLDWNENAKNFHRSCMLNKLSSSFTILQLKKFNLKGVCCCFFTTRLCDKIYINWN